MRKILTSLIALTALIGSACGSSSFSESSGGDSSSDLRSIVVTTSILGDMVTAALGDLVDSELTVDVIVPVGADAHEFAPSARQAETMENADLLVVNGLGYEEGMGDLIANATDAGAVAFAVAGPLEPQEGIDPHVWLDPVLMTEAIASLPEIVADNLGVPIGEVQTNVDAYIAELTALDVTISAQLDQVAASQRTIVTNHDALSRFAARYDLVVVDTIIPSVSTSAEASAAGLDDVLDAIRDNGVRAIFSESTASDDLAQALAAEIGEDIAVVELFTESLGEPGSDADTYIGMMTVNAERIAAALR
jgi:zinc/manganese transport system substrate-binding protein